MSLADESVRSGSLSRHQSQPAMHKRRTSRDLHQQHKVHHKGDGKSRVSVLHHNVLAKGPRASKSKKMIKPGSFHPSQQKAPGINSARLHHHVSNLHHLTSHLITEEQLGHEQRETANAEEKERQLRLVKKKKGRGKRGSSRRRRASLKISDVGSIGHGVSASSTLRENEHAVKLYQ